SARRALPLGTRREGRPVRVRARRHQARMVLPLHVPDALYIPAKILSFDGEVVGILVFGAGGLAWLLVPFFNKSPGHTKRNLAFTLFGVLVVIYIALMTVIGYLT